MKAYMTKAAPQGFQPFSITFDFETLWEANELLRAANLEMNHDHAGPVGEFNRLLGLKLTRALGAQMNLAEKKRAEEHIRSRVKALQAAVPEVAHPTPTMPVARALQAINEAKKVIRDAGWTYTENYQNRGEVSPSNKVAEPDRVKQAEVLNSISRAGDKVILKIWDGSLGFQELEAELAKAL